MPKIYFPHGSKRISGLDIPLHRERNISLLQGSDASNFLRTPSFMPTITLTNRWVLNNEASKITTYRKDAIPYEQSSKGSYRH